MFLDLDGGGTEAVDRVLQAKEIPNPHHVLNTSPGKHQIIWSVDGFEKDQAENLVRTMALRFEADQAVWDVARVLRIPGFRNHKYEKLKHFVKDVHQTPPVVKAYQPQDFVILPEGERRQQPAFAGLKPRTTKGSFSQSERDWAYVMRELGRGVDPDSLRSQLEQSRQDKRNPRYYAQRTVARAINASAQSQLNAAAKPRPSFRVRSG